MLLFVVVVSAAAACSCSSVFILPGQRLQPIPSARNGVKHWIPPRPRGPGAAGQTAGWRTCTHEHLWVVETRYHLQTHTRKGHYSRVTTVSKAYYVFVQQGFCFKERKLHPVGSKPNILTASSSQSLLITWGKKRMWGMWWWAEGTANEMEIWKLVCNRQPSAFRQSKREGMRRFLPPASDFYVLKNECQTEFHNWVIHCKIFLLLLFPLDEHLVYGRNLGHFFPSDVACCAGQFSVIFLREGLTAFRTNLFLSFIRKFNQHPFHGNGCCGWRLVRFRSCRWSCRRAGTTASWAWILLSGFGYKKAKACVDKLMETPQELSWKLLLPEEQKNNSLWDFKSASNKTKGHRCPQGNAWGPANETPCWTAGALCVGFPTCKNSSVKKHLLLFPQILCSEQGWAEGSSNSQLFTALERHSSQVLRENWVKEYFWASIQPVTCLRQGQLSLVFSIVQIAFGKCPDKHLGVMSFDL